MRVGAETKKKGRRRKVLEQVMETPLQQHRKVCFFRFSRIFRKNKFSSLLCVVRLVSGGLIVATLRKGRKEVNNHSARSKYTIRI